MITPNTSTRKSTVRTRRNDQRINHALVCAIRKPPPRLNPPVHARALLSHPGRPSLRPQTLDLLLRRLRLAIRAGVWCSRLSRLRVVLRLHKAGKLVGCAVGLGTGVGARGREPRCVRRGSGHCAGVNGVAEGGEGVLLIGESASSRMTPRLIA